ncbi:hypothetical protein AK812_SmicGene23763 [Symbiodinium microadriaticum]|uniref:Uncharacterized protein n=1 Tax=Symbiodinium microadriaticum TaxID=2951 RepID=A0A1Q9DGC7_SYMMI|nr:hypothetical protein AK812_SmicGene23763 [Symbiodinium microadriaticum]
MNRPEEQRSNEVSEEISLTSRNAGFYVRNLSASNPIRLCRTAAQEEVDAAAPLSHGGRRPIQHSDVIVLNPVQGVSLWLVFRDLFTERTDAAGPVAENSANASESKNKKRREILRASREAPAWMGGACGGPTGSVNCSDLFASPRPNLQTVASITCKDEPFDPPKAPKVTSRLVNGSMDPEVYRKALQGELLQHLEGKKVEGVLHVIIRLQAYVRRRQARRKVMRMREQQVVQHYMDPSVQKLKPTNLYLQSSPGFAREDWKEVASQLSDLPSWKR